LKQIFYIFDNRYALNWVIFFVCISLISCANQQPPGGGEEDKIPPKVTIISPKPNSVNFKGNSIEFEFNEYIDRRSFQDAFRTSPQVKGDIDFDWGARDVKVSFPKDLDKIDANKTFVVNISTGLKDIRGNSISEPVNFAFSTGSRIDLGAVSGKIFNANSKNVSILAYSLNSSQVYDPTENIPDYQTESTAEGSYTLTNMAPGRYRLISIYDEDKNLLYTSGRENFAVLPFDLDIKDSVTTPGINMYMKQISASTLLPELDYTKYYQDTASIIYTSLEPGSSLVLPDQSIFIFFNRFRPTREELVNNLKITDENGTAERTVFNWKNDSLVEVFAANKFAMNRKYELRLDIKTQGDSIYTFRLPFRTITINSFGELKGRLSADPESLNGDSPVRIELSAEKLVPVVKYGFDVRDTVFEFKNLLEANYNLFSFIDKNNNGVYDYGYPMPFEYSEQFYIYPSLIGIKGGWTVENVNIKLEKP
jgi:hypothetical protein